MNFILWQGVISIHQCAFVRSLAKHHNVTLVVAKKISDERKKQGWSVPDMGNARIIENPTEEMVNNFVNRVDTHSIFSGFDPFPLAKKAINMIVSRGEKFSLLLEPYDWRGVKGRLRQLKYILLAAKYNASIHRLFVTGTKAYQNYIRCGFSKAKIYQWGYFTMHPYRTQEKALSNRFEIIFVGALIDRKNCRMLIEEVKKNPHNVSLSVIGNGPLYDELNAITQEDKNIKLLGNLLNDQVHEYIANADILVLPSKFDGWGAVVNEALMVGTPVLASENCGSSIMLDGDVRGECFTFSNFHEVLNKWIKKGKTPVSARSKIIEWAEASISGQVVAEYFVDAINGISETAPWLKNK